MRVVINLIDLIELIFAGAVLAILVLYYIIICLIGSWFASLIRRVQERLGER